MSARLTAQNVSVSFGALDVLRDLSLTVHAGQFVALVGASGSGKSTLIRTFAGLQKPTSGMVMIDDQPITRPSPRVQLMFQTANLMPWRTVHENIGLPLEVAGVKSAQRNAQIETLLPMLGLTDFAYALPSTLSGGMAQRTALGRVLIAEPDVLLLDEPFGALDAMTREQISLDLLSMLEQSPKTVIMVTHDIHEAVLMADRVVVLSPRPGRVIADIPVHLPRPRHLEMVYEPEFGRIARDVRSAIKG
jgi:NitT/TauT family transport system ATP-binding protein